MRDLCLLVTKKNQFSGQRAHAICACREVVSHLTFNQECQAHRRFESSHAHHSLVQFKRVQWRQDGKQVTHPDHKITRDEREKALVVTFSVSRKSANPRDCKSRTFGYSGLDTHLTDQMGQPLAEAPSRLGATRQNKVPKMLLGQYNQSGGNSQSTSVQRSSLHMAIGAWVRTRRVNVLKREKPLLCLRSSYVWSERRSEKPEVCWFDSDRRHHHL